MVHLGFRIIKKKQEMTEEVRPAGGGNKSSEEGETELMLVNGAATECNRGDSC